MTHEHTLKPIVRLVIHMADTSDGPGKPWIVKRVEYSVDRPIPRYYTVARFDTHQQATRAIADEGGQQ